MANDITGDPVTGLRKFVFAVALATVVAHGSACAEEEGKTAGEETVKATCRITIEVEYPKLNKPRVDEIIANWVNDRVQEAAVTASDHLDTYEPEYDISGGIEYTMIQNSPEIVSVKFFCHLYPYRAAHPTGTVFILNLSGETGELLSLDNMFKDPGKALEIMSGHARQAITESLTKEFADDPDMNVPEMTESDWFMKGSAPSRDNYGCIGLEPEGIRVYFQQYQILPYFLGTPDALIPFEKLSPAGINEAILPKR